MKIKCEYCESIYDDSLGKCPHCGAPTPTVGHSASGTPKTIEELKKYCEDNGFTSEKTRFFIGENYLGAKAFGIYKDGTDYVVYKNKADATRSVRYRGSDEEYAVRELYMRLQEEILNQKAHHLQRKQAASAGNSRRGNLTNKLVTGFVILWFVVAAIVMLRGNRNGYYTYNNTHYYNLGGDWYYYATDYGDWHHSYDTPGELVENYGDYYDGDSWNSSYGTTDFSETDYYSDWEDDNDSDWSSSDWDSSDTDWDSDW